MKQSQEERRRIALSEQAKVMREKKKRQYQCKEIVCGETVRTMEVEEG
jgi:hypothetical protein